MNDFLFLIFQFAVLIFSVMVHEISHGYAAERLGDPTARLAGRLTLNPLRHIDPVGSIFLPLILFVTKSPVLIGWAKPVPYNPLALKKDMKYGPIKVAFAGPAANLLILVVFGLIARFGIALFDPVLVGLFGFIALLNVFLAIFNLVPIPPLDGSKILGLILPSRYAFALERMSMSGFIIVFFFVFFFSSVIFDLATRLFVLVAGWDVFELVARLVSSFS